MGPTLAVVVALGSGLPAQAGNGFILSTKSVAAPKGFYGICDRYDWACARRAHGSRNFSHAELMALAERVNSSVNRSVREVSDKQQYRVEEVWALPTRRGGDCEDFALLKKRELIRLGVSPDRLLIATALTKRREAHAILMLRTDAGDVVLDNLTSRIKPWRETGYSFLRMQDPEAPSQWRMLLAGGMFGA